MRSKTPAMQAGGLAFLNGKDETENPFSPVSQTSRYRDWLEGYQSVRKFSVPQRV